MPLLSTRGGGSAFGFGYGGGASDPWDGNFNLTLISTPDITANNAGFHTPYSNINAYTNNSSSNGTAYPGFGGGSAPTGMTMPQPGFFNFTLPVGTFSVTMRGGSGSGTSHSNKREFGFNLIVNSESEVLCMPGMHGGGNYGAGGMSGIFLGNDHANISPSDVVVVTGGGSGGYSDTATFQLVTDLSTDSNQSRQGPTTEVYDGGASVFNNYTVYRSSNVNSIAAQHVVQGALGGRGQDCGGSPNEGNRVSGGFGGGGGDCPGGGGGYPGGKGGGNTPNYTGGGGGRSYYTTSGNVTVGAGNIVTNSNSTHSSTVLSNYDTASSGMIRIVGPN